MGFLQDKWDKAQKERSDKLLDSISAKDVDNETRKFVEDLSMTFALDDVDIPATCPTPELSKELSRMRMTRIMIRQNFMIIKQLNDISKKLDKLK